MKTSRLLLAALFLTVASLPLAAQVNDTYIITAAANQGGANNTRWLTQFSIFNPQLDHDLVVSVTFLPTGGAQGAEERITVPRNSLAFSDNILLDLFGIANGGGSLLVATFPEDNPGVPNTVLDRSFLVTTNTYNNASSGTYGQTNPGVWIGMLDDGITAIAQNVRNSSRSGWRTNIGAVNLGRCSATLRVNVYDADGNTILKNAPFVMPPLGHFQDRLPVDNDAATVEFWVEDPCASSNTDYAVVFPYASTIDPRSGDPQYQAPMLLAPLSSLTSKGVRTTALASDPTSIGKKIDTKYARGVREQAEYRGMATLMHDAKGWRIQR